MLGKSVLLAGQVGVSGHLTIHDNAVVYAQSGIGGDVEAGAVMSGSPAFEAREWLRAITAFPETAGDFEDNATIGETAGRGGTGRSQTHE